MSDKGAIGGALGLMVLLMMLIFGALGWSGLALQWKRFHDRGRPGYLAMLPMVIVVPAMFSLVGHVLSGAPPETAATSLQPYVMISSLVNVWFFIDLGCLGGVDGPNRYGNPPGGGFSGGGSPVSAPTAPARGGQQGAGSLAFLGGAEKAMERAICGASARASHGGRSRSRGRDSASSPDWPQRGVSARLWAPRDALTPALRRARTSPCVAASTSSHRRRLSSRHSRWR